jgi:hypothetical protein
LALKMPEVLLSEVFAGLYFFLLCKSAMAHARFSL